jgi:hypothetical protein
MWPYAYVAIFTRIKKGSGMANITLTAFWRHKQIA